MNSSMRKSTGSPLWRQVVDKKTPDKKKVVISDTETTGHVSSKIDRKSLDQFDSHPRHNPDPKVRKMFDDLFPEKKAAKKTETQEPEEKAAINPTTP